MNIEDTKEQTDIDPEECDRRCKEFAEITGTDSACGHFFLQDCDWKLEIALNKFFGNDTPIDSPPTSKPLEELILISWNIDGLDNKNRTSRTEAVCSIIKQESPAFVFLQEVVPETLAILDGSLTPDFSTTAPSSNYNSYFNVLLINTKVAKKLSYNVIEFPDTQMMRDLLQVEIARLSDLSMSTIDELLNRLLEFYEAEAHGRLKLSATDSLKPAIRFGIGKIGRKTFGGTIIGRIRQSVVEIDNKPVVLLVTHLESTREFRKARMKQYQLCMETIQRLPYTKSVIFGGDLNIRDDEISSKLEDVHDVWEATGSKSQDKFTWDCLQNDNLQSIAGSGSKFKPRCRFDRLYFRNSEPKMFDITDFKLIGKSRIRSCLCFPSDHWGLRCAFKIIK